jgi:hypothetical protein
VELVPFDESYLQCLRNRDFPTEQHFVAYFNKLLPIKLCSRLDSSRLSLQTRVALLTLPPERSTRLFNRTARRLLARETWLRQTMRRARSFTSSSPDRRRT